MCAFSSGQHLLRRHKGFGWRDLRGTFHVEGLAADHGCRQVRRTRQRGQSRQSTGARGCGWGTASGRTETGEGGESSCHNTALTRRGLTVVLLS